jgi:hypothetical protein
VRSAPLELNTVMGIINYKHAHEFSAKRLMCVPEGR